LLWLSSWEQPPTQCSLTTTMTLTKASLAASVLLIPESETRLIQGKNVRHAVALNVRGKRKEGLA